MQPMRIDVSSILEDLGASEEFDGGYPMDHLVVGEEEFTLVEPAEVSVILTNTGSGVVASGTVTARVSTPCSRCLEPFELVIAGSIEGFYVLPGRDAELPEDQEAEPVLSDNSVDLAAALVAALTVEAPFAPVHDESCAGLCPVCGCDLNVKSCDCHETVPESHPFAGLKDLLGGEDAQR